MMKALALIAAVVTLTGCSDQDVEDVSTILKDGIQVAEAANNDNMDEIKEEVEAAEDAETEPAATTAPSAGATKPAETAKPAETTKSAEKAKPAAEKESVPVYECTCGFTASTEEELWNHVIYEMSGSGTGSLGSGNGTQSSETGSSGGQSSSEQPAETQALPAKTQPAVTVPSEPEHTHVWKEHLAETQTWVPNIVMVDDYETQRVCIGSHYICNCGFETDDGNTMDEHGIAHVLADEMCNFQSIPQYEDQQVKVGSHEEDQGHYETSTYVDYYYCDCGATK